MRSDMAQVLVERPRVGRRLRFFGRRSSYLRKSSGRWSEEASPRGMPMRFAATKALNENLMPLVRYLRKQQGRRWDDVYSEIRQRLAPRNAIDMHIMQHLWDYVWFARREPDGRVALIGQYGAPRSYLPHAGGHFDWHGEVFYVCCESRHLVRLERPRRKRKRGSCP